MKKLLIAVIFTFLLSGCWSYKELNDIAIVNAIGIDMKENEYIISAQVMNPKKESSGIKTGQTDTIIYTGKGNSIIEALRNITLEAPKRMNVSHLELLVINEKVARKGIEKIADQFLREAETRNDTILLVTKEEQRAADILGIITPLEVYPSQNILKSIEISKKYQGQTTNTRFDEFTEEILKPGINPVTSSLKVVNKTKDGFTKDNLEKTLTTTYVKLDNIAIFKDYKLKGFLNDDESLYYNLVENNVTSAIINLSCSKKENELMSIEILKSKSNLKSEIKGNNVEGTFNINIEANIAEIQCNEDIYGAKNLQKIEKEIIQHINKNIKKMVKTTQEYKSDVFGFGEYLYQNKHKSFIPLQDNWDKDSFPKMKLNVKTKVNLTDTGNLIKSMEGADHGKK